MQQVNFSLRYQHFWFIHLRREIFNLLAWVLPFVLWGVVLNDCLSFGLWSTWAAYGIRFSWTIACRLFITRNSIEVFNHSQFFVLNLLVSQGMLAVELIISLRYFLDWTLPRTCNKSTFVLTWSRVETLSLWYLFVWLNRS